MSYKYDFGKKSKRSIASVKNLLEALDITDAELRSVKLLSDDEKYKRKEIEKSDGSVRVVYSPDKNLRKIQKRINRRIFNQRHMKGGLISWPSYLYGSIPNTPAGVGSLHDEPISRDYVSCAGQHCESKSLFKMDISDFFDNIHESHVYSVFSDLLKFPEEVSTELTSLCCFKGNVVQGALTSSYIASAILFDIEPKVVKRLHRKKLVYTRLVDDITVSSKTLNYNFSYSEKIISEMLCEKDLPVNSEKTITSRCSSEELMVHGLRVSYKEPRLPSQEVSRIRASVKNLELLAQDSKYRVSRDYRKSFDRCQGRVNKLGRLGQKQHKILLDRILRIKPLPRKEDIDLAERFITKLERWYMTNRAEFWYWSLHNKAHAELNVLQRSFWKESKKFRVRLGGIKPEYEDF
jgi:RNA-directed DNA polymerase